MKRAPSDEFAAQALARCGSRDERAADAVRLLALRMVPPGHKGLDVRLLKRLLASRSPALRLEAVRMLSETAFPDTPSMLRALAADKRAERSLRLTAIAGLAAVLQRDEHDSATLGLLRRLLAGSDHEVRVAALRALRHRCGIPMFGPRSWVWRARAATGAGAAGLHALTEQIPVAFRMSGLAVPKEVDALALPRPSAAEDWIRLGASGGSADAGRRIFEHPNAGGCFRCHTVKGRGGKIGPDLSLIAKSANRAKLAESIVRPSKEIAPQFASWTLVTRAGRVVVGRIIDEDREGHIRIGTSEGTVIPLDAADVEERRPGTSR